MGPIIPFLGAILFGTAAGASAAYVLAVNLARIAILSLASKLAAPKIDLTQSAANKMLTIRSTVQAQSFTYGEDMLSGPLIFANTTGESNKELTRLVALHGREIDDIIDFRIDDTDVLIPTDIPDRSDDVVGGRFTGVMAIDTKLGSLTQTAVADLVTRYPTLWTSAAHRCRGWSLLYTRMTVLSGNQAYQNGIPQNMRAKCRGHLLYDPRLDDTNGGTGPHRLNDDTTWEFSSNPAICLADFLRFENVGYGEDDERIDWPLVIIAADICDELVVVPVSATQKRYTCNFTFLSTTAREQIKEMLETAMLGRTVFSQGVWKMWAGAAQTADVTLTEANMSPGSIQLQASSGSTDRYNRVRGKFVDPTRNYTANAYPEQRSALFEAEDNVVKYQVFDVNTANNSFEAQRDAIIKLRQSRMQRVLVFPGNWSCFRIQPGTVVELDIAELGFNGEKFFVTEWSLQTDASGVNLVMVEEVDSVWNDPAENDYTIRSPTGELIFSVQDVCALTSADIHNERLDPADTFAGVRLLPDGKLEIQLANGGWTNAAVPPNEWMVFPDDYWVTATLNTGTLTGPDTAVGLFSLDAIRAWDLERTELGTDDANITLDIADNASGAPILCSAVFDLEAVVFSEVRFPDIQVEHIRFWDGTTSNIEAIAGIRWANDEVIEARIGNVFSDIQTWWGGIPTTAPSSIQARNTTISVPWSLAEHGLGVWFDINIGPLAEQFFMTRSGNTEGFGTNSQTAQFEFRDEVNPLVILDSFTCVCIATLTS
jgi:hypothetical protein